ncbi:MAG: hypothetical protein V3T23_13405 [Nitrososphaerales archaeon]
MQLRYPPLRNEDEFEELCLSLFRLYWNRPNLQRYGRRGQRQHGIDLIDLSGKPPFRAAQCKCLDPSRAITPSEIREEVKKAETFHQPVERYAILTTAKDSTDSQEAILEINREHAAKGLFEVELIAWERISRLLDEYGEVAHLSYSTMGYREVALVKQSISDLKLGIEALGAEKGEGEFSAEIDRAKEQIESHNYEQARFLLQQLRDRHWDKLVPRQRFRVLSNLASCHLAFG